MHWGLSNWQPESGHLSHIVKMVNFFRNANVDYANLVYWTDERVRDYKIVTFMTPG